MNAGDLVAAAWEDNPGLVLETVIIGRIPWVNILWTQSGITELCMEKQRDLKVLSRTKI
tara:strand:- start:904 stop:1080 length:177 start_codon:yes stop_codon:yes gene_type:complete